MLFAAVWKRSIMIFISIIFLCIVLNRNLRFFKSTYGQQNIQD
jgi:hypothetical protein